MSDRLKRGLESSGERIRIGIAEAEDELSVIQRRCTELEDMISLGKAIFIAAEMQIGRSLTAVQALAAAETEEPRIVEPVLDTTLEAPRLEPASAPVEPATPPAREPVPEPVMEQAPARIATAVAVAEVPEFPMALDLATQLTGETVSPPVRETAGTDPEPETLTEQDAEAPTLAELLVGMGSAPASANPSAAVGSSEYLMADLELAMDEPTVVAVAGSEAEAEKESRRTTTLAARLAGGHIRLTNADLERSAAELAERLRNATVARTIAS